MVTPSASPGFVSVQDTATALPGVSTAESPVGAVPALRLNGLVWDLFGPDKGLSAVGERGAEEGVPLRVQIAVIWSRGSVSAVTGACFGVTAIEVVEVTGPKSNETAAPELQAELEEIGVVNVNGVVVEMDEVVNCQSTLKPVTGAVQS